MGSVKAQPRFVFSPINHLRVPIPVTQNPNEVTAAVKGGSTIRWWE
jgi:hypothetical protein